MAQYRVKTVLPGIGLVIYFKNVGKKILDASFECPGHEVYLSQGWSGHSEIFLFYGNEVSTKFRPVYPRLRPAKS